MLTLTYFVPIFYLYTHLKFGSVIRCFGVVVIAAVHFHFTKSNLDSAHVKIHSAACRGLPSKEPQVVIPDG